MQTFESKLARSSHYRPEIDGLRALAVLPVLFFHEGVPGFAGGFVGVDIFYVISGYLITSIIAKDVAVGRFSFVSFYERRIRRIFPALFGVVFFSFLAGSILLAPQDLAAFGKSLLAMTFFASNLLFKRDGGVDGYFGATSNSQVLLHTWSLSVEEQFYLFFPTTLILLARYAKKGTKQCLWLGLAVSFVASVWLTEYNPLSAFYLLFPRAWELLLGALLALKAIPVLKRRASREIAGLVGLGLIVWSVSTFTKDTPFPGFAASLPCLGAWLIIYAGENGQSSVKTILGFRPLVFIGIISYSLYLWHWPIIVFSKYVFVGELRAFEVALVLLSSLVMAFISYEFIESPFRGGDSSFTRRQIFVFGFATSALSAALGFAAYFTHGFPGRYSDSTRRLIAQNIDRKKDYKDICSNWKSEIKSLSDIKFCNIGPQSAKKIMFWGDSHVQQLYPLIQRIHDAGGLRERGAMFAVVTGCSPTEHMNRPEGGFHCDSFSHFAMMRAEEEDVDTIFIGFAAPPVWDLCPSADGRCVGKTSAEETRRRVIEEVSEHIRELKMHGKRVIVSLPFPLFDKSIPDLEVSNAVLKRFGIAGVATEVTLPDVRNQLALIATSMGAEIFDPRKSLCRDRDCTTEIDGVSIYKDNSHIAASQIGILEDNMERTLR